MKRNRGLLIIWLQTVFYFIFSLLTVFLLSCEMITFNLQNVVHELEGLMGTLVKMKKRDPQVSSANVDLLVLSTGGLVCVTLCKHWN